MTHDSLREPQPSGRRRQKLSDEVAGTIEEWIFRGKLRAGDRLPIESELTEQLRVSRTVIRDAVRVLAARGLLDVRQGFGTVVSPPSANGYAEAAITLLLRSDCTVGEMWEARELLDREMTSAAIRTGRASWGAAEDALRRAEVAATAEDWGTLDEAHYRFHVSLMAASGNPVIELLLGPMHQIIHLSSELLQAESPSGLGDLLNLPLHLPMLEAAKRGDEAAFAKAVVEHYSFISKRRYRSEAKLLFRDSPAGLDALRFIQSRLGRS